MMSKLTTLYDRFDARAFWILVLAAAVLKTVLALLIPLTGDEGYFLSWARFPALGYYDHPPMAGWIIWLLSPLGEGVVLPRLFAVASSTLIGILLYRELKQTLGDRSKAAVLGAIYFLSPIYLVNTLFTTDTALILFVFLSGLLFVRAQRSGSGRLMLLSGMLLGLAFLSKYFAVLLLPAFAVALLVHRKRPVRNLALIGLGMLPFVLLHLYWNWENCWITLRFNFTFRSRGGVRWDELFEHLLFQLYLATPWVLFLLAARVRSLAARLRENDLSSYLFLFGIPMLVLTLASLKGSGLHWALAFYPFLPPLLAGLGEQRLRAVFLAHGGLFVLQVAAALIILSLPVTLLKDHPKYADVVMYTQGDEVCRALEPFRNEYLFTASTGYSTAAAMTHFCGEYFPVLLGKSKHGRLDDTVTDFRRFDGRDILVFGVKELDPDDYRPYFREIEARTLVVLGGTFHLILGKGFSFDAYRARFLSGIRDKYYRIPEALPCGGCPFLERYFPEERCGS
jgi:hypothetical protein